MLWAAIVYAIVGSLLTNTVGHPLVSINYQMQRVEVDFRFGLIHLHESNDWWRVLSPGEQQSLAGARVLMHKPEYVFLDEATSALDHENEAHLYHLLTERLPNATIVSVTHGKSLAEFHQATRDIASARVRTVADTRLPPA